RVSYHDYEGLAVDIDERTRLVRDLGDNPVMILRNHGLLAVGKSIPLAFSNLFNLQFACETQVLAMAGNAALTLPAPAVSEHTAKLALAPAAPFGREGAGLLRKLDRIDPSYRTWGFGGPSKFILPPALSRASPSATWSASAPRGRP